MLEEIEKYGEYITTVIEICNAETLKYLTQHMIMKHFDIDSSCVFKAETAKQLRTDLSLVTVSPLQGERWLIIVDVDKIGVSDCLKQLGNNIATAIVLFITGNYRTYKSLITSKTYIERQNNHNIAQLYLSRLSDIDINLLYDYYMRDKTDEEKQRFKLMKYIKKNYKYNIDLVCTLFNFIQSGTIPQTEREVIELVGIGGNTPAAFTVSLLTTTTKTEKGIERFMKRNLMLLNDLALKYKYDSIYAFMFDTLNGICDMKELQISGKYMYFYRSLPENFDEKRIGRLNRLKRFERTILEKVSLNRTLCLMACLKSTEYDKEMVLVQGLYKYAERIGVSCQSE